LRDKISNLAFNLDLGTNLQSSEWSIVLLAVILFVKCPTLLCPVLYLFNFSQFHILFPASFPENGVCKKSCKWLEILDEWRSTVSWCWIESHHLCLLEKSGLKMAHVESTVFCIYIYTAG